MNLAHLDATAQADLIRRGELSPVESVEAAIDRIDHIDPALNAVIHPRFDRALAEARSLEVETQPFAGVPILLKDFGCPQAGEPHHAGLRALRDHGFREERDCWLVERFRAAGFVILGRTNAPELACAATTEPLAYGQTHNPWSLDHSTGGSSGGSAAAVAAGLVPVAHGGDGGGSIRMPSSCCGLVGLKPARGRLTLGPADGVHWGGLSTDGVMTRSVRDTAAIIDWVSGPGCGDPYAAHALPRTLGDALVAGSETPTKDRPKLRIGVRHEAFGLGDATHPEVVAAVGLAESMLAELGHQLRPASPAALDEDEIPALQGIVVATWVAAALDAWGERIGREILLDELEPLNALTVQSARNHTAVDYTRAVGRLHAFSRRAVSWWEAFDLLLLPTITDLTPRLGEMHADLTPEQVSGLRKRLGWLTPPWNITGQPAISLPLASSEKGLPIGIQLVAAPDREDLLIEVARTLEQSADWARKRPPVHA
ncbi:MAG: amidase [bacterium]|nr:6-aminohexanoate hydrolase [Deltaproteobacteria bacterium]MCP4907477.1 amidase [bacterium]